MSVIAKTWKDITMFKLLKLSIVAITAITAFTLSSNVATARSVAERAAAARPVSSHALYEIYKNKSWIWKRGGGYYSTSGWDFTAWDNHGKNATIAKGKWYTWFGGKVCFEALWSSTKWSVVKTTCFAHRTDGKNIFQRRLPKGKWYVFKHTPVRSYDEISKLKSGNRGKKRYSRNKRSIEKGITNICSRQLTLIHFMRCLFKK